MLKNKYKYKTTMDYYFEEEEQSYQNWAESYEIEDEITDEGLGAQDDDGPSMELLNQYDYNLNSPIINDNIYYLSHWIHGFDVPNIFLIKSWDVVKELINKGKIMTKIWESKDHPHKFLFSWMVKNKFLSTRFKSLVESSTQFATQTLEIPESFFKHCKLAKQGLDYFSLLDNKISEEMWGYGEIFWDFHLLTLIMNKTGHKELVQLKENFGGQLVKLSNNIFGFKIKSLFFGDVIIVEQFMVSLNHGFIFDRNLILMMKDLTISRFQTLCSMALNIETPFQVTKLEDLVNLYSLGDQIISRRGNSGYTGLKLIEPMCNLQLCKLAHKYRPLLNLSQDFERHVNDSVLEEDDEFGTLSQMYHQILAENEVEMVLIYYSIFRHWGHPHIEYIEGLRKLHEQVTMEKNIDDQYAQQLASDLAFKMLKGRFFEKKKWFVNKALIDKNNILYKHIMNDTWPNPHSINQFGDNWHKLPIIQMFDIPDFIEPSTIYSDKAHSMSRSEVLEHVRTNPDKPIPTRRVLQTLLKEEATNWGEFLRQINDIGLDLDDLVIGLKPKEREQKIIGRFFSLMSWKLREYFVCTEYLIKTFFVPRFKGLTMADDLQEVMKKMLTNSNGQGLDDYSYVSIANHIDYQKWNNHQRYESNCHVFKVMGQCFGLPNLFTRTHEFFQKSLIYYASRPDLMLVEGDSLKPKNNSELVCWDGQAGGFEGLRQKGWSVLNCLVIERESKVRNTSIKILAQGDNQTISTMYKLQTSQDERELISELDHIVKNNEAVMRAIRRGTERLGLLINEDETMISGDYLNYGKVPIFRGSVKGLHAKRWSRVNFSTNDQIPSLASNISSVSTNALMVGHLSGNAINPIFLHNFFANLSIEIMMQWNPALRNKPSKLIKDSNILVDWRFRALLIFLDPSLGGIGGTSLTRFLIRMFPDPVCESLSFWKTVYNNTTNIELKELIPKIGLPALEDFQPEHLDKLIESPESLNLKRGVSITNLMKTEIKKSIIANSSLINNKIIRDAVEYLADEEGSLFAWARNVTPLFPRFLSEFMECTYYGITKSVIGLFQNSKTIRNQFKKKYPVRLDEVVLKSEIIGLASLIKIVKSKERPYMWECSSKLADTLREISWGTKVLGTTIPHPIELLGPPQNLNNYCDSCRKNDSQMDDHLTVMIPKGLLRCSYQRGPYTPYLGSSTSETTSLMQPWEKETKLPLLKRAAKIRNAISWFIDPNSNLAKSIMANLEALTGIDWSGSTPGFKRTGSAIHRFTTSRVSSGGYSAMSPGVLSWMICTTDTLCNLTGKNYDFMFQSLIVLSQALMSMVWWENPYPVNGHFHINCLSCIREIQEPTLESQWVLPVRKVDHLLKTWIPSDPNSWSKEKVKLTFKNANWETLPIGNKVFHIGQNMGFLYVDMLLSHNKHTEDSSLFPLGLGPKLIPSEFFLGLLNGIERGCSLQLAHRRNIIELKKPKQALWGSIYYALECLSMNVSFLGLLRQNNLLNEVMSIPHKIPSSYPLNNIDLGAIGRNYLKSLMFQSVRSRKLTTREKTIWLFADTQAHENAGSTVLSVLAHKELIEGKKPKLVQQNIKRLQELYIKIKNDEWPMEIVELIKEHVQSSDSEVRHAVKEMVQVEVDSESRELNWGEEASFQVHNYYVAYTELPMPKVIMTVPRRQCPLISGLRLFQYATGAHYKIRSILKNFKIDRVHALIGGDGSGGISSYVCRAHPLNKVIFNSLLELEGIDFKGSHPSPPQAIFELGPTKDRCVNWKTVWSKPSDLSLPITWDYFEEEVANNKMQINLEIFDMEVRDDEMIDKIETLVVTRGIGLLSVKGTLIFKTYYSRLMGSNRKNILDKMRSLFKEVWMCQTDVSSTFTSEVYLVFYELLDTPLADRYVDYEVLGNYWENIFCFWSDTDEFKRALTMKKQNMLCGVPKKILANPSIELSTLLVCVGLESGLAVSIAQSVENYVMKRQGLNFAVSLMGLVFESTLPVASKTILSLYHLPSNNILEEVFSFLIGVYYWISYTIESKDLFSWCNWVIHDGLNVKLLKPKDVRVKRTNVPVYQASWRLYLRIGEETIMSKNIKFKSRQALIGQTIRILEKIFGNQNHQPISDCHINSILIPYNKGLSLKILYDHTDIMFFLLNCN
ncbi:polymerase [Joinjakaka virus]|uniref:Replicase n=2 Tax=Joinjakaka virus TaxID=1272943 RepID=A0A0D3R1N4_9RHAB|nr:polymerase [Joinjakaka virus]AJR28531.1 polymerase [Joinjakaka virus]